MRCSEPRPVFRGVSRDQQQADIQPDGLPDMTPEGKVKAKVNKVLKTLGADCWRFMPVQTGYGAPALDYLLCYRGRFIAIETKAPGGKLTALQEITKTAMEAAGALVLVVFDDDSLAIALQIILFEDFGHGQGHHLITGTRAAASPAKKQAQGEQHLRKQLAGEAPDAATGGDHGTPRKPPRRQPKSYTGL